MEIGIITYAFLFFFFQAEDGIRDDLVTGVQTCALPIFHKMKETVALIRNYAPQSKIVLGGYGTVLKDEVLIPYADYLCREEGVAFFRRLLGEPGISMPYKHPLLVSWLKAVRWKGSGTGKM